MEIFKRWAEHYGFNALYWARLGEWEIAADNAKRAYHNAQVWYRG